jgi:hypothetical protein
MALSAVHCSLHEIAKVAAAITECSLPHSLFLPAVTIRTLHKMSYYSLFVQQPLKAFLLDVHDWPAGSAFVDF